MKTKKEKKIHKIERGKSKGTIKSLGHRFDASNYSYPLSSPQRGAAHTCWILIASPIFS